MQPATTTTCVVLIPIFNDWPSVSRVADEFDRMPSSADIVRIVLVDDGSSDPCPAALTTRPAGSPQVEVLRLPENVGHQRAIAIGLAYVHASIRSDAVVIMD